LAGATAAKRIGILVNPKGPRTVTRDLQVAPGIVGLPFHMLEASTDDELETAFAKIAQLRLRMLVIGTDTFFNSKSTLLAALALRHKVPAVYKYREFVAAGGLMSYAGSITDAYRQVGVYVGRILKGEKPADLPVQQTTKAELFINLKTAKLLGLTVPATFLARADEVIE
jgi:putative tryptophan/tyrosine transport system substrate-binding protein